MGINIFFQKKNQNAENNDLALKESHPKVPRSRKMLTAFGILFIIIAILIFFSWILNWAHVKTSLKSTQTEVLGLYLWRDDQLKQFLPGSEEFKAIFSNAKLINNQESLIKLLEQWLSQNLDYRFDRWDLRLTTTTEIVEIQPLGVLEIFFIPIKGFVKQSEIIIFVLIVGGFLFLVMQTKALEGFSQSFIYKLQGKEIWAILPIMLFFSLCGTIEGMAEEALTFYAFSIPLMLLAGFDTMTGFLIVFLGAGIGVVGSTVVPFSVVPAMAALNSASTSAGGPSDFILLSDGLVWRFITWIVISLAAIGFVIAYSWKIKHHPELSVTFKTKIADQKFFLTETQEKIVMTWQRKVTLAIFFFTYALMLVYLINWDTLFQINFFGQLGQKINQSLPWLTNLIPGFGHGSLLEVSCFFLISGIVVGIINRLSENNFVKDFVQGAADLLSVCLVIGTASGIAIVLEISHMQHLVLNGLESSLGTLHSNIGKLILLFLIFIPPFHFYPFDIWICSSHFPSPFKHRLH